MSINFNSTRCCYCERLFNEKLKRTKEHIIPKSKGGKNNLHNLIYACFECNSFRGNKDYAELSEFINNILNNNKSIKIKPYSYNRIDLIKILENLK
ncbi:MAG: HNH endonuclease [Sediminibacterium sp.]